MPIFFYIILDECNPESEIHISKKIDTLLFSNSRSQSLSENDDNNETRNDVIIENIEFIKTNEEDEEEVNGPSFPDTQIKIEHDTGKVTVTNDSKLRERYISEAAEEMENVIFLGDDKPYIIQPLPARKKQQPNPSKSKQNKQQKVKHHTSQQSQNEEKEVSSQAKRGQKGKIRKIKEKYKDQDEEERKLRMDILKSSGESKQQKKKRAAEIEVAAKKAAGKKFEPKVKDIDADDVEEPAAADVEMLDSLTGIPHEEDELLFAVPVIAPYQTLQNYK